MVVVETEIKPMITTPTDATVLRMSALADKIKYLDSQLYELFEEWRTMQSECIRVGLQVDVLRSQALEAAYIAWMANREPDRAPTTVDEWPVSAPRLEIGAQGASAEYARNGDDAA